MKKKLSIIALALVMLVCSIPIMPVTASDTPDYTENFSSGAIAEANTGVMSIGDPYNTGSTATSHLSVTDGVLYSMASNYANSTKKDNVLKIATEVNGKTLKKITGTMQIGTDTYTVGNEKTGAISLVYKSADDKLHAVAINPNRQHSTTAGYIGNHTYTLGASEDSWSHVLDNASGVSVGTVNNANPATGEQKFTLEYTDTGFTYTLHRTVGTTTTDYSINITYADGDVKECMFLLCGRSSMLNGLSELNLYYEGTGEVVPDPEPEPEPEPEVSSTVTEDFNDGTLESYLQWVSLDGRTDTSNYYTKEGTDKSFGPKNEGTNVAINTNYLSIAMENNGQRLLKVEGELYSGDGRTWGIAYQQTDGTYTGVGLDGFKEDKTGDDRYRFRLSDLASSNNAWTNSNTGYKETTISDGYTGQADLFKSKTTWISFSFEYDYSNSQVILTVQDSAKQVWTCTQTYSADMNTLVCMLAVLGNKTGSDANIPKIDNLTMTYGEVSSEPDSGTDTEEPEPEIPDVEEPEPEPEVPEYDVEVDFSAASSSLYEDKTSEADILAIYSALGITPTETPVYSFDGALNINTYYSGNNTNTTSVTTGDYTFTADGGGYNGLTALIGLKENPGLIDKLQFTCTITAAAHQAPVLVTSYTNDAVFDSIAISAVPTLRYYTRAYSTDSNTVTITQGTDLVTYTDRECTVAATENLTAGEATVTMEFVVVDGNPYYLVEISDGTNSHYFRWEITELLDNFYLGTVRYNSKISSLKYNVFSGVGDANITNLTNQQFVKLRALSVLHSDLFTDDEKTVLEAATGYVVTYTADEFAAYRTGDAYTAPTPINQYLFAGWYCDNACKTAVGTATKAVETETVYAKFVPAAVLTVKAQISVNLVDTIATNDEIGNIRFITTVDSLRYSQVGFKLSYDKGDGNPVKDRISASNKVYTELYAVGSTSGEDKTYKPTDFCKISQYFKACTVRNVKEIYYGMEFTVTSFWITLDGTTVDGETVVKTVDEAMVRNAVYVSSSGTNAAGYGTYSRPYETLTYALDKVAKTGTIYVKDTCSMTSDAWIEHGKTLTITSADEGSLGTVDFSSLSELHINDAVTFDKINLGLATTVYANGNALEITKDVTLTNADGKVTLYGGSEDKPVAETNLTLYAGSYAKIYGGGYQQDVIGNTNVTIGGAVNDEIDQYVHGGGQDLFGGGYDGTVGGNTYVKVVGGNSKFDYIFGGGYGSSSEVVGTCTVEFNGWAETIMGGSRKGTCANTYVTMTAGYVESIFGGSEGNHIGNATDKNASANVTVLSGTVKRRVYGGCYNNLDESTFEWTEFWQVYGNSNVTLGPNVEFLFDYTEEKEILFATVTVDADNSLYAISRGGAPFDNEYGTFIVNSSSSYKYGCQDDTFINFADKFSKYTYHYFVTTNGNTGTTDSPGTVTADGDTLIIAPAPGYTATVTDGNGNTTTFDAEGTYTFPSVSTEEQIAIEVTFN